MKQFWQSWARDCTVKKGTGQWWELTDREGTKTLVSYDTPVMRQYKDGTTVRFVKECSMTTFQHIRKWSGLRANEFRELPIVPIERG